MPSLASPWRNWRPKASTPSAPTRATSAPSRAAATAWLAPLPPGTVTNRSPRMVSPGPTKRGAWVSRSMLMLPTTTMRVIRSPPGKEAWRRAYAMGRGVVGGSGRRGLAHGALARLLPQLLILLQLAVAEHVAQLLFTVLPDRAPLHGLDWPRCGPPARPCATSRVNRPVPGPKRTDPPDWRVCGQRCGEGGLSRG